MELKKKKEMKQVRSRWKESDEQKIVLHTENEYDKAGVARS